MSDLEHNDEIEMEEEFRDDNSEGLNIKYNEPKKILKLTGLILNSIGGILYLITVFMVSQTYTSSIFPASSWPFLIAGVISLMGTIIGVKDIKAGSMFILLSLPATFLIGVIFSPYLDYFVYFIFFVFIPFPLPHSVFVISGGILCLLSYMRKIN